MTVAINVSGLVKDYGDVHAVRGIDFSVDEGEMFGFLGPNGAGKSTTIKILCTLADPTAGSASVAGHDVVSERSRVRRSIGLVFQDPTLDLYLTARQNLSFHGELYGVSKAALRRRIDDVLEMVGLADRRDDKVQTFSGGMKRRLEIGRGLLHSPRVLFLDEPTIGLDPQTRASIWEYVALLREAEDITVFMTTHYMDEAEHCDRIAIMNEGRLAVIDSPDALKSSIGNDRVQFRTEDDERAIAEVRERFGLEAAMHNGMLTIQVPHGAEFVPRLFDGLSVPITMVTVTRPSLDDVFMTYTGTTISDAERPKAGMR
jgi:ABC-2 type transport system ATP-binding protein